jgi:hypothetical protein
MDMDWGTVAAIAVGIPLAFLVMALAGAFVVGIAGPIVVRRMGGLARCSCASVPVCGPRPETEPREPA